MSRSHNTFRCNFTRGQRSQLVLDERGRLRLQRVEEGYRPAGEFVSEIIPAHGIRHIFWQTQWITPQRWHKYERNPVYGPFASGAWDSWTNGVSIIPTDDNRSYRMYYAGQRGEGIGFAEASLDNPVHWQEHPSSPVLLPRENWEGGQINQPRVVKVTEAHWRMYYTGWGYDGPGTNWALGLAESFDGGTTWQRVQDEPILPRGDAASPDGAGACVPMVLRLGERWLMWYTAGQINPAGHQNIHICHASSTDGVHWEKHPDNPVLSDDFTDGATRSVTSRCYVRYENAVFQMWYSFAKPDYRILYAESLDGINWERSAITPVLDVSPASAWDDTMVEYPEIQVVDGAYRLWFCGNGYGSVGYAEGIAETGVEVSVQSGDTESPGVGWTSWTPIEQGAQVCGRFFQIRARLHTTNPHLSPALNHITISDTATQKG